MRTIALEEHFVTESYVRATAAYNEVIGMVLPEVRSKLLDLGAGRIAAMDEAGIDLQVVSLVAFGLGGLDASEGSALGRDVNDELAAAIRANPARLAGFATLALKDPQGAAEELDRCVNKLGFVGPMLNGTTDGLFLDEERFLPVFEAAAALGVPIYLHPAPPPQTVYEEYYSGLRSPLGHLLSIAGWGWHSETAIHALRLILSGLFDRLPSLQIVVGHMGEGLPYALARSSSILSGAARLKQTVAEYFETNIHVTTSGYFTLPPFRCALEVVGIDRLMFSVDYPFSPNTRGREFLNEAAGMLNAGDMEKLTHRNAERLFRLPDVQA